MGLLNFGFIADEFVVRVRERFLNECFEMEPQDYDEDEIHKKIIEDDWFIKRFLILSYKNEEDAVKSLSVAMKWRKEYGLKSLKDNYFPREFYQTGALFTYEKDLNGLPSLIMRLKYFKRIPELLETVKMFCIYNCYKIDEMTNGSGWVLVMDFTDCGYSHYYNLDVLHYFVTTMHYYFPAGMDYVIAVDLPWILSFCWSIVKVWIPEKRQGMVKFATKDTLIDFFPLENLPPILGGKCTRDYKQVPENSPTGIEFGQSIGVEIDRCEEIIEEYRPLVEEAERESREPQEESDYAEY